jgi:hypothetical protein
MALFMLYAEYQSQNIPGGFTYEKGNENCCVRFGQFGSRCCYFRRSRSHRYQTKFS